MIGSFLSRALIMIFGYAYPAYECFKVVEKTESEMEQLLFWCQYWILVAMLTVCERVGDNLLSWLPMYSEAKLAFFIYLWHQKTRGTMYVYNCFFQPFVRKHETEIDDRLLELRVEGGRMALVYWEKAAIYGQAKLFEILQFASSQSALWCHFGQQEPNAATNGEPPVSDQISLDTKERQCKEPNSHSQQPHDQPSNDLEKMPNEPSASSSSRGSENLVCSQQETETVIRESVQIARGKWRLFRSAAAKPLNV
ncbi:putative HVA22-like protein g isoform X2 [Ricinus communis]|uniref:putative HVA22-like protein g isoform X2 n=2 Tax=Ricinus communis TaxID=3988 RepID=UPI00201A4ABE|nr:putative HVA22-like protein g isoform X2 [Ricinus communis]